jgi:hypothetical protein
MLIAIFFISWWVQNAFQITYFLWIWVIHSFQQLCYAIMYCLLLFFTPFILRLTCMFTHAVFIWVEILLPWQFRYCYSQSCFGVSFCNFNRWPFLVINPLQTCYRRYHYQSPNFSMEKDHALDISLYFKMNW